jgi:hypothetical protein
VGSVVAWIGERVAPHSGLERTRSPLAVEFFSRARTTSATTARLVSGLSNPSEGRETCASAPCSKPLTLTLTIARSAPFSLRAARRIRSCISARIPSGRLVAASGDQDIHLRFPADGSIGRWSAGTSSSASPPAWAGLYGSSAQTLSRQDPRLPPSAVPGETQTASNGGTKARGQRSYQGLSGHPSQAATPFR